MKRPLSRIFFRMQDAQHVKLNNKEKRGVRVSGTGFFLFDGEKMILFLFNFKINSGTFFQLQINEAKETFE